MMWSVARWHTVYPNRNWELDIEVQLPDGITPSEGVPGLQRWDMELRRSDSVHQLNALYDLSRWDLINLRNALTAVLADSED
jgi:hypothetical protein